MCYCVSKQLFINSSGLSSDVCSSAAGAAPDFGIRASPEEGYGFDVHGLTSGLVCL